MKLKSLAAFSIIMLANLVYAQHTRNNSKSSSYKTDNRKSKFVNNEDPVCKMKTAKHISDTAVYKKSIYGFCSSHCKNRFKQNPEKYLK